MDQALLKPEDDVCPAHGPMLSAENAGLLYVTDDEPGIARRKAGTGFGYYKSDEPVRDEKLLARIRGLAIPPAWTGVWICAKASGHIQATGRDARDRKQYLYHPKWNEVRDETKYERLVDFAERLPHIRRRIDKDLSARGLTRVFVEGGGLTVSRFLAAGCLDRLHVTVAPVLLGSGIPAFTLPEVPRIADGLRFTWTVHEIAPDILLDIALDRARPGGEA